MRSPRFQALGPLVILGVLWFLHNELLYIAANQGLVEQVIGGGGGVATSTLLVAAAFVVVRGMLYLLGPGLALLVVRYLVWPGKVSQTARATADSGRTPTHPQTDSPACLDPQSPAPP